LPPGADSNGNRDEREVSRAAEVSSACRHEGT
jgi:hypothetical protein